MSSTTQSSRRLARSLFVAVLPQQLLFFFIPTVVVLFSVMDKHCVAKELRDRRCGKDVTPEDLIAALNCLPRFSSLDVDCLEEDLENIAILCICKNKHYARPHSLQAPVIAKGWIEKANCCMGIS